MIFGLTVTHTERERERERESTRGIGPPYKLWSSCKLCPPFVVCCASSVHLLSSAMQATSTISLLFLLHSLSFPLTNHGRIFNYMSPIYNLPPTLAVAATFRSNHRSCCPKPQTRYRSWQSTIGRAPLGSATHWSIWPPPPIIDLAVTDHQPTPLHSSTWFGHRHPPSTSILFFPIYLSFPQSLTFSSSPHRVCE